ncbi:diguanylate cyclase [Marinobacter sp. CHS3-4]|uniref:sensor domain-containing diguanylate cyclase n=1 Tax=Marinobacter sp. CHS3-4 TaxID=3045174 RepID=UPI0024B5DDE6|nr:diguanylate cyclase [Marinobacter sp. CHS3-4]MDI9244647.1 diguanylate cyclase [Marinobacter sp. CHS3-4]
MLDAEFVLDPSAERSFEEIMALPDSAWTETENQSVRMPFWDSDYWSGTQGGVLWLRLEIPPAEGLNRLWLELLPNTGLDGKAAQYDGKQWTWIEPIGKDSTREFHQPARYLTFILDTGLGEKTVFLRLTTDQVFGFSIRATRVEGLLWQITKSQFFLGVVIGMVILAICYNLSIGLRAREPVYLRYSFFVFCNLLYLVYMAGLFRMLYPDSGSGAVVANFTSTLTVIASYQFARSFLNIAEQLPRIDKVLKALIGAFAVLLAFIPFTGHLYGYLISISIGIIGPVFLLYVAILSFREGHPLAKYFLIAWTTFLISAGAWGWMWLGLVEPEEELITFFYLGTLIEVVLLSVALGFRFSILKNQAEALGADKSRYKTLSRTDELTGVLNRRGFTRAVRWVFGSDRSVDLVWLALDVDQFKQFNDTHGHLAGDRLLQKLGETLIAFSRSDDVAGRIGGEEFALLLVGCPLEKAELYTTRLLHRFADISVEGAHGQSASTTLSIGATQVRPGEDVESVWARADELLYEAKKQGRNRVVFG